MSGRTVGEAAKQTGLGMFAGVFTPSILTILGIIFFMRLGYVVGSVGMGRALLIIGLANAISILTSVSISAIATNLTVKGGGDYYLISRTLGVEFGGSIGVVLFLAQSISIGFYAIGFGEALSAMFPKAAFADPQIIAALAVSVIFVFAWLGADWATKFQYVVMAVLTAALVSFFFGGIGRVDYGLLIENWDAPSWNPGFWVTFAVFFPAVTGFTQGVSMSGDLKDPGKSLPMGTFLAVGISIIVYFFVALIFGSAMPLKGLFGDYGAMKQLSEFGFIIDAGVIAATLSSAMASFMGAPRILQSLAGDRIFPFLSPFAQGSGPADNPRRGVLLSGGVALVVIGLGNLNLVASIVSMFFLISYGLLNYATWFEATSESPSFRPRFKWFHRRISLAGFFACLGVMLAIDFVSGLFAVSILFAIHQYLKRTTTTLRWADSSRSHHLQIIRQNLIAASCLYDHPRDWRPHILAFSLDFQRRKRLIDFSLWLGGGSGTTTVVRLIEGTDVASLKLKKEMEKELKTEIDQSKFPVFPLVVSAADFAEGLNVIVQSFGIGPIRTNTILLNWVRQNSDEILRFSEKRYGPNLKIAFRHGLNLVILDGSEEEWDGLKDIEPENRVIDVWWADDASGRLMLLFAYLTTRSDTWKNGRIRVLAMESEGVKLKTMMDDFRIEADIEIVEHIDLNSIITESEQSSLVFLPFRIKKNEISLYFNANLKETLAGLPIAALVLAGEDIALDAEPEEGKAGEAAAAQDRYNEDCKRAKDAEQEAEKAAESARIKLQQLHQAEFSGATREALADMESRAALAEKKAAHAFRRAGKAAAGMEQSLKDLEKMGLITEDQDEENQID